MNLHQSTAQIFVPDGQPADAACGRITHLGIGAHPDDLEFMAFHGIAECFGHPTKCFGGVTCTDGAGSRRTGAFARFTDAQMMAVRGAEQNQAAVIGRYGVMIQLGYASQAARAAAAELQADLEQILAATRPQTVYMHNLADKHDTHVGVALATLHALRARPAAERPKHVIGCEVWRDLDWLDDADKVLMDVSGHDALAAELTGVFASQIAGGKRYDLATLARRTANATFLKPRATDEAGRIIFGMDLTPLVADETRDIADFVAGHIAALAADVRRRLTRPRSPSGSVRPGN